MPFQLITTPIEGLVILEPKVFSDGRGFFMETYQRQEFHTLGILAEFVQDNHARSKKGTLRGLHFQKKHPQGKLVRVIRGKVFDVAVDLRRSSKSFGRHFGMLLDEESKRQFYVPPGFAHGYLALSDDTEFEYKCTDFYHPQDEGGVIWNDPDLNIAWPTQGIQEIVVSPKDQKLPRFRDLPDVFP